MKGVQFVIDDSGKKKAVLIDLEEWGELWEDFYDLMMAESRKHEDSIPWEEIKQKWSSKSLKVMEYQVAFAASALREFRALSWDIKNRLRLTVDGLRENPRPSGVRKIQGRENLYRLRIGSYRLVYEVDDQERKIQVIRVRHRRDAYR